MSSLKNVYFLGPKSVTALAAYPQHFDVCVMPYRVDDYTDNIYPLKLHEYLASGRPIVGSPIRTLRDFGEVIALAEGLEQWSGALYEAIGPAASAPAAVAARQRVALEQDWEWLVHSQAQTICERLGPQYSDRFAKLGPAAKRSGPAPG